MWKFQNEHRETVRNLMIFVLVVLVIGWVGYGLDRLFKNLPGRQLGLLLWLLAPLVTAMLLRSFAGDSWKDFGIRLNFKDNGSWYAVSLLLYPIGAALVLAIGWILGMVSAPHFSFYSFFAIFGAGLVPSFFKNICEEFAWRGYLTPRIHSLGVNDYAGHLLVGLIWGCWHIPYWLFFLDRDLLGAATTQSLAVFIPMAIINIMAASIVYGEIRLLTNSVWPPLLMHTVGNSMVDPLVVMGLIKITAGMDFLVAPGHQSLLALLFFGLVGIGLRRMRMRRDLGGVGRSNRGFYMK